jgi:hypothetical protein
MSDVANVADAAAPGPVVETNTPAVETPAGNDPGVSADEKLTDELSAVWDKSQTGNERADDGKFVSNNPAEGEQSKGPADPNAKPAVEGQADPAIPPVIPPAHLTAEQKAKFATLPREAQESFVEIEKAREAVYTRKDQETAEFRKSAEPILQAVQPFKQYLEQLAPMIGQSPDRLIAGLLGVEYQLRTGTQEQKRQALSQILSTYQIDLASEQGQFAPDPRIAQLEQQVNQLTHHLTEGQRQEQERQLTAAQAHIQDFNKDKPYFEDVRPMMALFLGNGQATDLSQAYDMAVHANPAIRERVLADARKADDAKRQEEAAKRAEDARKSGKVNVRSGTAQPTPKTMDEEIEELARRAYG